MLGWVVWPHKRPYNLKHMSQDAQQVEPALPAGRAASGTGTAGRPPPSGAESGCVREAVWRPHCGYRHCLLCAV